LPLLLPATIASPIRKENVERASCAYTCGSHCYSASAVSATQAEGYSLYQSGETLHDYPHVYHDYEGFDFSVSGTYYEFPILSDGAVYDGGSPGADRVIFNTADQLAGLITHTGASSSSGFVECS
ncbi:extracellular guanyl-specific ribonuclease RntA, partial [Aspergillus saccharolyticus JOP 1030-1]